MGTQNELLLENKTIDDYKNEFSDFESYIKNVNNPSQKDSLLDGYLVNYTDYTNLKNLVDFHYNNAETKKMPNPFMKNVYDPYGNEQTNAINAIKQKKLDIISFENAKHQIENNKQFIIINDKISDLICKQKSPKKIAIK